MVALPEEVGTRPSLDQLAVEVDRVLDRLVLDGEDLDSLDHLVKEELA